MKKATKCTRSTRTAEAAKARRAARIAKPVRAPKTVQTALAAAIGAGLLLQGGHSSVGVGPVAAPVREVAFTVVVGDPGGDSGGADEGGSEKAASSDSPSAQKDSEQSGTDQDATDQGGTASGPAATSAAQDASGQEQAETEKTGDTPTAGASTPVDDASAPPAARTPEPTAEPASSSEQPSTSIAGTTRDEEPQASRPSGNTVPATGQGTGADPSRAAATTPGAPQDPTSSSARRGATTEPGASPAAAISGSAALDTRTDGTPAARVARTVTESVMSRLALVLAGIVPSTTGPSAPVAPSSALLLAQWALFRRSQNPLFNQSPVVTPGQTGDPTTGEVRGDLQATDPDGDPLTYTVTDGPEHGTVQLGTDGTWTYQPDAGYVGRDSFTITVRDNDPQAPGLGGLTSLVHDALAARHPTLADRLFGAHTTSVTIPVVVDGPAAPPVDADTVVSPSTGVVTGTLNVVAGPGEHYTVVTPPRRGTLTIHPDGTYEYVAHPDARLAAARTSLDTPGAPPLTDTFTVRVDRDIVSSARQARLASFATLDAPATSTESVPIAPVGNVHAVPSTGAPVAVGPLPSRLQVSRDGSLVYVDSITGLTSVVHTADGTVTTFPSSTLGSSHTEFNPDGSRAVVVSDYRYPFTDPATVTVVDTATGAALGTVTVGPTPGYVHFSPDGRLAYITDYQDGTVRVIDTGDGSSVRIVDVGRGSVLSQLSPDGSRLYAVSGEKKTVTVIDTATGDTVGTIPVGGNPGWPTFSPDGSRGFVTNNDDNSVTLFDTATNDVVTTLTFDAIPGSLAFSPDGSLTYVTVPDARQVRVVDTTTGATVATITVGATAGEVQFSPDGTRAFVPNYDDGTVTVVDTADHRVVRTLTVGSGPQGLQFSDDGRRAYVVSRDDKRVTVIDTASGTILKSVAVGDFPESVVFSPDGGRAYVVSSTGTTVIDTATDAVSTLSLDGHGVYPQFSLDGARIYATDYEAKTITVFDAATGTVRKTITDVPTYSLRPSPDGRFVYSSSYQDNQVVFVNTLDDTVTVVPIAKPTDVVFSPDGKYAYVASSGDGTLTVISLDGEASSAHSGATGGDLEAA